jgi:hypothetical protein
MKDRSDVLPVPYEATVSQVHVVPPFHRQMRKLMEALGLDTPASKLIVSLLSVVRSRALIVTYGRSSDTRGLPDVVELISTRTPSFE